jgi:hypothetical protein
MISGGSLDIFWQIPIVVTLFIMSAFYAHFGGRNRWHH